jgi:Family of unknown function (DUF6220)
VQHVQVAKLPLDAKELVGIFDRQATAAHHGPVMKLGRGLAIEVDRRDYRRGFDARFVPFRVVLPMCLRAWLWFSSSWLGLARSPSSTISGSNDNNFAAHGLVGTLVVLVALVIVVLALIGRWSSRATKLSAALLGLMIVQFVLGVSGAGTSPVLGGAACGERAFGHGRCRPACQGRASTSMIAAVRCRRVIALAVIEHPRRRSRGRSGWGYTLCHALEAARIQRASRSGDGLQPLQGAAGCVRVPCGGGCGADRRDDLSSIDVLVV